MFLLLFYSNQIRGDAFWWDAELSEFDGSTGVHKRVEGTKKWNALKSAIDTHESNMSRSLACGS